MVVPSRLARKRFEKNGTKRDRLKFPMDHNRTSWAFRIVRLRGTNEDLEFVAASLLNNLGSQGAVLNLIVTS